MKPSADHYWVDMTSNTSGILETMSSEEAISGTRQNAARTVMDRRKYASRFSLTPLPTPNFFFLKIVLKYIRNEKRRSTKEASTSSEKAIQKARTNRIIDPPKRGVILSFAELGYQKKPSKTLFVSLSFQQLQAVLQIGTVCFLCS